MTPDDAPKLTLSEKDSAFFWSGVKKGNEGQCWEWTRAKTGDGYGAMTVDRKFALTHRVSFQIHHRLLLKGELVCHACDNPQCTNPAHLFAGTHKDNARDCSAKGRNGKYRGDRHWTRSRPDMVRRGVEIRNSKIKEAQVSFIRAAHAAGATARSLAALYGVTESTMGSLVNRKTWRHVS